jgi:hypothetical protein
LQGRREKWAGVRKNLGSVFNRRGAEVAERRGGGKLFVSGYLLLVGEKPGLWNFNRRLGGKELGLCGF